MDLGIPFVPQPAAWPPPASPARPAPDATDPAFDAALQISMSGAGAERPAHAPGRTRSEGARPGAAEPAPALASGAAKAAPGRRAALEGTRSAGTPASPDIRQPARPAAPARANAPASDANVPSQQTGADNAPSAASPVAAARVRDDATATDAKATNTDAKADVTAEAKVPDVSASAPNVPTDPIAVVDVAVATAVIPPMTLDPVPDAASLPIADATALPATVPTQVPIVVQPIAAQPIVAQPVAPALAPVSDGVVARRVSTPQRAADVETTIAERGIGAGAGSDVESMKPAGRQLALAGAIQPGGSSPAATPAATEPTPTEPVPVTPEDAEPIALARPQPAPTSPRPVAQPVASSPVQPVAARVVRSLSPLAEQVKAIVDSAAAIEPEPTGSAPNENTDSTPPEVAVNRNTSASDKAQAMARAIVRASVEGLALMADTGDNKTAAPGAPAAKPTGDAVSPTLMSHLFVVSPLAVRNEARAAYAGEPVLADASAPVLPPVAATPDASSGQHSSSSGNAPMPGPETVPHATAGATTGAVFALPAPIPETLTLGGVATATATPTGTPVTMVELPRQIVRSIVVQVADGVSEARLRINPEHLGEVTVRLRVERTGVTAVLHADSAQVKAWIEAHQDDLRSALGAQGLQLDGLTVTTDPDDRRREPPSQEPQHRPRPRAVDPSKTFELLV